MENQWVDRFQYPFVSRYFEVNRVKLHYIDEGQGEILLFVHGTPSWSFDYRNVILALRDRYRCVAIDHIGFGLSEKPKDYDYSTRNHSQTLETFILENDLKDLTLVVHDFGGPIALNVAIRHPERVKRLVIMNSWLWSSLDDPEFVKFSRILKHPLITLAYRYFNFSPKFVLPSSFGDNKLPKQLLSQYTSPFKTSDERNGVLAFVRSLVADQDWFEGLWQQRYVISGKPTLFVWGMKDPVIKPHYLGKFQSGFPYAQTVALETCGHFPQEEQPAMVSQAIAEFLKSS